MSRWSNLDLPGLRFARTVLHARNIDLVITEGEPTAADAVAEVNIEVGGSRVGTIAAVPWPGQTDVQSKDLIRSMLEVAATELSAAVERREHEMGRNRKRRASRSGYSALTGDSPLMQSLYETIERVSASETTVLISGENGTGKELVARAIHHQSARVNQRFVVTNCSAFNDNLLDSELFGHKRGAFTGAVADKPGLFEIADGGTFFLDEIGDMSPVLQVKVLRILQEGTFNRVGDTETRKVDVRIISATNRDLSGMVRAGTFREDLFYRINVINVELPALRTRKSDIPLLINTFLKDQGKTVSPQCLELLMAYAWPGNVRELENEIERLLVLTGDAKEIGHELLSPRIRDFRAVKEPEPIANNLPDAIEHLQRRMIVETLGQWRGNKTKAADVLGISRRNLIRLAQKYGL